jgi:hypothetical protein
LDVEALQTGSGLEGRAEALRAYRRAMQGEIELEEHGRGRGREGE